VRDHDVPPRLTALVAILVVGCGGSPPDNGPGVVTCNELRPPFELHACLGRMANPTPSTGADYYVEGVIGSPPPEDVSCLTRRMAPPLVQRYALTSKDDTWVLEIATTGVIWPLFAAGESVSARYLRFGNHQHLMIRDAAGTRALLGDSAELALVVMPKDLDLTAGDASCQITLGCVVNVKYRLRVTSGGITNEVETDRLTDFGGVRVFTAGILRQTPAGCAAPDTARVTFGIFRL
jgi:hypothetical protein